MYFHITGTIPDPSRIPATREAESAISLQLQKEGIILIAVRRLDHPGVFLVVEAEDRAHAEANMARLPWIADGTMTFDYIEVDRV
jgi:hypothetical protein